MSVINRLHLAAVLAVTVTAGVVLGLAPPAAPEAKPAAPSYRVTGPHSHDNLTVFFLHGEDAIKGKKLVTLDEALKAKQVIVHETRNVNELSIENVSTETVFVQAGDIVKGGQQDRTIAVDLIVPPKSGRLPVSSFCVESGRWAARGGENVRQFSSSSGALVNNELKLAARGAKNQSEVWKGVQNAQQKLSMAVKGAVQDSRSQTSLQLTLEHKKLQDAIEACVKMLEPALDPKASDAIGYAVVINGKVNSADVYANADLFRRLWPKLVRATAIEAVSEKKEGQKIDTIKAEAVTAFLKEAHTGKRQARKVTDQLQEVQQESARNVLFETQAPADKAAIRRSYLAK